MLTDPVSDLLTRLRNGVRAKHATITVPSSKLKINILDVLKQQGYIMDYQKVTNGVLPELAIQLNSDYKDLHLKRVSMPGQRIYVQSRAIKKVLRGYGISILSTPKGVMTGEEARKNGVGGEYLCEVW